MTSLRNFVSRVLDTTPALAKPVVSAGTDIARMATRSIGGMLTEQTTPRYRAFISYSHADMAFARWLHRAIENYRVPSQLIGTDGDFGSVPARLRPVFRDEDELAGAAQLGPELEDALRNSAALIVICSPESARSQWVDKEIRTFKRLNPDAPVLAVIARGQPGVPDAPCFPEALLFGVDANGEIDRSITLEPLAPDLQKQERQVVKLKLIAGLLGLSYGVLQQRDRRRARRIATAMTIFALVLIAILSALSIAAISYARIAVRERDAAEAARQLAEENADKAERRAWLAQASATEMRRLADMQTQCTPKGDGRGGQ